MEDFFIFGTEESWMNFKTCGGVNKFNRKARKDFLLSAFVKRQSSQSFADLDCVNTTSILMNSAKNLCVLCGKKINRKAKSIQTFANPAKTFVFSAIKNNLKIS
ncbi:hypothetical protein SD960_12735 [Flavobacterium sp. MMLR14_040]|uniref:hypothetical protein n=1 Tax=Flavobacterium sp. MMLR14_040 TaxID=3093843 RepID=UPI0029901744|nr:hypothetical protein [Flavobacterium sp. MMLR14_040]MDW8850963.1 hypothetical protein [Flavobacterium sp. MMLR14_040]